MMKRDTLFSETRTRVPELWEASHKEVHDYLESEKRQTLEVNKTVGKLNAVTRLTKSATT
jgi:hypothetical protein